MALPTISEAYDGRGNMITHGSTYYNHDSQNRLTSVTGGGVNMAYVYDPAGRRIYSGDFNGPDTGYVHAGDMEIRRA